MSTQEQERLRGELVVARREIDRAEAVGEDAVRARRDARIEEEGTSHG